MNFKLLVVLAIFQQAHANWKGSCDIRDTVDVNGGVKDSSGNLLWNGINFLSGTFGESKYDATGNEVGNHIRGCICKYKPCIRSCTTNYSNFATLKTPTGDIDVNLTNYQVLIGKTCEEQYTLDPYDKDYKGDDWKLFPNGSLMFQKSIARYNEYCFNYGENNVTIFMCFPESSEELSNTWNVVGKIFFYSFAKM
jgi:hypothetical protein